MLKVVKNRTKRLILHVFLGVLTCLVLVAPAGFAQSPSSSTSQRLTANLQQAEAVLTAQSSSASLVRYVAILTNDGVVPTSPSTEAAGVAGAVLAGDRLVVRGDFRNLSGALRDYAVDPVDPPNPNITSAVHIHQGAPTENGPFQYALTVMLNESSRGGRFSGEYTLTPEQLQALSEGRLYMDLHTQTNRAGELRGAIRPV